MRGSTRFIVAMTLALATASAEAAKIRVSPASPLSGDARLVFRRIDAPQPVTERNVPIGSVLDFEMTAGTWEVEVQSPGMWAARRIFAASEDVDLPVWPTGILRGTFRGEPPSVLRAAFGSESPLRGPHGPQGETVCTIDGAGWRCEIPAGLQQVRLMPSAAAPIFLWDRRITAAAPLDAGTIAIVPGAAVSGFVTTDTRGRARAVDLSSVRVAMTPVGGAATRAITATPDARGHFLFAGVTAGQYLVRASGPHLVSHPVEVRVLPRLTASLRDPLILSAPRLLSLAIVPRMTPAGGKWSVRLLASRAGAAAHTDVVVESSADQEGTWTQQLAPGEYSLEVRTTDGSVWAEESVRVGDRDQDVAVAIPLLRVSGTVHFGEKPLGDAIITFAQKTRVIVRTDHDGKFESVTSGSADEPWLVIVESDKPTVRTEIHDVTPHIRDGVAVFDVAVPQTVISGRCLDADGAPVKGAIINAASESGVFQQAFAESDGTFELLGLPHGRYRITADAFLKESSATELDIGEEPMTDLVLTLRSQVEFKGRLFAPNQTPIPHATVLALPRDARAQITVPQAETDDVGGFDVLLPPGTGVVDAVFAAPGFALAVARIRVTTDKVVPIYCDPYGGQVVITAPPASRVLIHHGDAELPAPWLAAKSRGAVGDGSIVLGFVEPGRYEACSASNCVSGFLAPGGELKLTLPDDGNSAAAAPQRP